MNRPLVSIIIPAYNASDFLFEAIDSVLKQTYKNIEIIIVNDGSPDYGATEKIALDYRERYPDRIKYFFKENGGCASALNYGMKVMTGEYFSWLSHDDLYLSEKLERLIKLVEQYNLDAENTVLGCNDFIMGSNGKLKKNLFNNSTGILSPVKAFHETLNVKTINGCGLLIPKRILDIVGEFRTDYKHLLDREYWMRIAINGFEYCYAEEPLVISRVHNKQITVKAQNLLYNEETKLIDEYTQIISDKKQKDFLKPLCYFAYKRKHYQQGKIIKGMIKENNQLDLYTRCTIIKFYIRGILRKCVRKLYKSLLRR